MTGFSTRASLEVTLDDRSVREAKNTLESELGGTSVRASLGGSSRSTLSAVSDGGRAAGSSVRDLLETSNELLVSIRDTLEEGAFSNAGRGGGGGTTIIGGIGLGAAGTVAAGGAASALLTRGSLNLAERLGLTSEDVARDRRQVDQGSFLDTFTDAASDTVLNLVDPAGIGQTIAQKLIDGAPEAADRVTSAFDSAATDLTNGVRSTLESVQFETPSWVSTLLNTQLERPGWLTRLTNFRLREPEWLSTLRQFLGVGGGSSTDGSGPRGGTGRASDVPATRIPGQTGMEMSLSVEADTRGFERAVTDVLKDLENNRAFQTAVENVLRRQFNI